MLREWIAEYFYRLSPVHRLAWSAIQLLGHRIEFVP
jgi:hypothetical protein